MINQVDKILRFEYHTHLHRLPFWQLTCNQQPPTLFPTSFWVSNTSFCLKHHNRTQRSSPSGLGLPCILRICLFLSQRLLSCSPWTCSMLHSGKKRLVVWKLLLESEFRFASLPWCILKFTTPSLTRSMSRFQPY